MRHKQLSSCVVCRFYVKCGSAGSIMCKMLETVWVITHILHMVNSDSLTMNGVLGVMV